MISPVVGRERAAYLHRLHPVGPLQAPDAERLVPLADHQAAVLRQLGQRAPAGRGGRGRLGAAHSTRSVVREALRVKVRLAQTADPDVDVDPLGDRIDRPVQDLQADLHLRVADGELGQSGRDVMAAEAGARAHAQRPARRAPGDRELLGHVVHIGEDALRPAVDRLAVVRDRDAAGGPVQEPDAECGLEQADAAC